MVGVGCEVAGPIQPTVIVPDGEDVGLPELYVLDCIEDLSHQDLEVLSWVGVHGGHLATRLPRELLHGCLDHRVRVIIEPLEVVAEVSHDVAAFQDILQELVFPPHVLYVHFFLLAQVRTWALHELVLEAMDRPPNVSG